MRIELPYKFGWKLCLNRDGENISPWVKYAGIRYFIGRFAFPIDGRGPLCVFSEYRQAVDFAECNNLAYNGTIYPCIYIPSERRQIYTRNFSRKDLGSLPEGTILAEGVKLL